VSSEVARFLRRRLGQEVRLRQARRGADDPGAWKVYQVAIRLRDDADSLRLSRDTTGARQLYDRVDSLLTVAARMDRKWPQPILERGWTALSRARIRSVTLSEADTVPLREGIDDADRILATEEDSAAALELRGNLEWFLSRAAEPRGGEDGQAILGASERDLRAATTMDPRLARAWAVLAYILKGNGKFEEARLAARRMSEADPYLSNDVVYLYMSAALALELGQTARADSLFGRGQVLYPRVAAYPAGRLVILASRPAGPGAVAGAWALLRQTEDLNGPWQKGRYCVAATLARAGLADSARAVARSARAMDPGSPTVPHEEAYLALLLGDRDQALSLLGRYLELMPHERAYVARDWWWTPLHGDPRFQALIDPASDTLRRPVG
ncbi:MAG TPA: tetratricopeptide repeat protein, partial [Gemmatimonadota bacterium]|nr:tetratricopeptide repeat protein [Gemmatimonadota bacterium]